MSFIEWESLPCRVAGRVSKHELSFEDEFSKSELREKSKPILFALAAARRALSHARFEGQQFHRYGERHWSYYVINISNYDR